MSDGNVTPPTGTPTPAATIEAPKTETKADAEPHWLRGRLEETKTATQKRILQELGVEDIEIAKQVFAKAKADAEASKTEAERTKAIAAENEALKKALEESTKAKTELDALKEQQTKERDAKADAELAALSPERRALVIAIAGDRKGRALRTMEAMRPVWASEDAAKGILPAPATTTASAGTPGEGNAPRVDHKAQYQALSDPKSPSFNPIKANAYLLAHLHPEIGASVIAPIQNTSRDR